MAILQISRIQNRRGLKEDLPQLSSAELGWSVDTRELYIGNGNVLLSPQPGLNTRILTEHDLSIINQGLGNVTLLDNVSPGTFAVVVEPTLSSTIVNYSISRDLAGNIEQRTGTMRIASRTNNVVFSDDYVETTNLGITLAANVTVVAGNISLTYSSTAGNTAQLITSSISFI